jgi:hypothetical protein
VIRRSRLGIDDPLPKPANCRKLDAAPELSSVVSCRPQRAKEESRAMKKKQMSKLAVSRETLAALESRELTGQDLGVAAGGSARTACGSCPPRSCIGTHCCFPTG